MGNDAVNVLDAELTTNLPFVKKIVSGAVKFWSVLCVEGQRSTQDPIFLVCRKMQYTTLIL